MLHPQNPVDVHSGASTTEVMLAGNWRTVAHGRPLQRRVPLPNAGPSKSICDGWNSRDGTDSKTTATPHHSGINASNDQAMIRHSCGRFVRQW